METTPDSNCFGPGPTAQTPTDHLESESRRGDEDTFSEFQLTQKKQPSKTASWKSQSDTGYLSQRITLSRVENVFDSACGTNPFGHSRSGLLRGAQALNPLAS